MKLPDNYETKFHGTVPYHIKLFCQNLMLRRQCLYNTYSSRLDKIIDHIGHMRMISATEHCFDLVYSVLNLTF